MEVDTDVVTSTSSSFAKGLKKIKLDLAPGDTLVHVDSSLPATCPEPQLLEEYNFPHTDPQTFAKSGKFNTVNEIMEILTSPNNYKRDHMATAEMCPSVKRPRVTINKGNVKALYGFDLDHQTYLHPEEALYLVETGKLEVLTEGVAVSVERARLLFLQSSEIPSCSPTEYIVYKHFAKLGYRLQRKCPEYLSSCSEPVNEPVEKPMEEDSVATCVDGNNGSECSRGTKRRAETSQPEHEELVDSASFGDNLGQPKAESAVIVEDDDSDCEFIEEVENESKTVYVTDLDDDAPLFGDEVTMDDAFYPSTSGGAAACPTASPPLPYTVVESDSDIEFVDEVSNTYCAVRIEEISSESESILSCEAGPSTSQGSQVLVDLVSSDSEEEGVVLVEKEEYKPIWAKCIPNTKIKFTFPPSPFLPENILPRAAHKVYEYSLLNQPQVSADVEIETILDRVRLDANTNVTAANGDETSGGTWKEWRENAMADALHVFNDSLFGKARTEERNNGGWNWSRKTTSTNLHQWKPLSPETEQNKKVTSALNMPYDLYPPAAAQVHRNKLGVIVKPIHRIAIVSEEEFVPNSLEFPSSEEEAPLLVTVVGKDSSIVQILCNIQPIQPVF